MKDSARAVVIGGGVGGCAILYWLARLGWSDVVLVERADLTSGSTFHSAGLVGQLRSSLSLTKMMMESVELYRTLGGEVELETGWREVGSLRLASSQERLEEIGETWGHYLVESPAPHAAVTDAEAIDRLLELLGEAGFRPELRDSPRTREIHMRPCPFLELARRHQDVVCPIHLGLIRGALDELGAPTTASTLEPFVRDDLCIAHLRRR